jgi:hypothetical protein
MHDATTTRRSPARTVVVVGLVLLSVAALTAAAVPGAATQPERVAQSSGDGPAVRNVTTNRTGGNLTVSVYATNVTEVDVTGIPEDWSVATHDDDYGAYAAQLDEDRVFWFWRVPVAVNVSVTFETPANAEPTADLAVVPYDGTDRGQAVAVFPEANAATPTSTPTSAPGTPTATGTAGPSESTDAATPVVDATPTPTPGEATETDATGAGFGAVAVLVALSALLVARWRQ